MSRLDAKIRKSTRDRRGYDTPTANGVTCHNLLLDPITKGAVIVENQTGNTVHRARKCVCKLPAPKCSYHLGESHTVTVNGVQTTQYFCERYLPWSADNEKPPVDTHNKVLDVQQGSLNWY